MIKQLTLACLGTLDESELPSLNYPVLCSPKIDGYRCAIQDQQALYRSEKPPQNLASESRLSALPFAADGEITMGDPWAEGVFGKTGSALRTIEGQPDITYWVFDRLDMPDAPYHERLKALTEEVLALNLPWVSVVPHIWCHTPEEVLALEQQWTLMGYEGLMVRDPNALYLEGRSGREPYTLLRFKRFYTSEIRVLEVLEGFKNAPGLSGSSRARGRLVPSGLTGGLRGVDLQTNQEFVVAPGKMTHKESAWVLLHKSEYEGRVCTYRFDKKGGYELPRFPTFQGWRDDM